METDRELKLKIADIIVSLRFNGPLGAYQCLGQYADFTCRAGAPIVTVDVQVQTGARFIPVVPGTWKIRSVVKRNRLIFVSYFESGWVDFRRARGRLVVARKGRIENFLRVLFAYLSLERDGLLTHAAGVVRGEKAYVFFGPSNSGKTTLAKLSEQYTILSDDLVLLKKEQGIVYAYGVPFRGEAPERPRSCAKARLVRLFRLRKDDRHFITPVEKTKGMAALVACIPYLMSTSEVSHRVMRLVEDLVTMVPVEELHFRRNPGVWGAIEPLTIGLGSKKV